MEALILLALFPVILCNPLAEVGGREAAETKALYEENACKSTSLVKVGSSDKFGCYQGENGPQCWRKTNITTASYFLNWLYSWAYHNWCNIPNEKCTKSLHKSAKCVLKHSSLPLKQTSVNYGSVCVNNWTDNYCDLRTGKRYGCYKRSGTCWRTCDKKTDTKCSSKGWCYVYAGYCRYDASCLEVTTKPCSAEARLIVKT